jgi:zinc transport system permease protein
MPGGFQLEFLDTLADHLDLAGFELRALISVVLVAAVCGMVGAMVVGNRMAFFSDALAHCAFAGVALAVLMTYFVAVGKEREELQRWLVPIVMIGFGTTVGIGIAFVRENTGLSSDTVIGVFFAGAIGFGAMLLTALKGRRAIDPEQFLFGSPIFVKDIDLLYLLILFLLTICFLLWRFNHFVLGSFNTSLARSRRVALRTNNYLFIILLAFIVNLSISAVGVLLINAMLIVPAATASNFARNLRQMFWWTFILSVIAGLGGLYISSHLYVHLGPGQPVQFGPSGTIITLSAVGFFISMLGVSVARRLHDRKMRAEVRDEPPLPRPA